MITQDSIEALKTRLDIVDVIGSFIELKKTGANFKASCPFHGEKTASFVVSPKKQIYHCFGCGVGGDSIKFVMEYEKLSYPEALEKLALTYNFSLSYSDNKSIKTDSNIMERVNSYFQKLLFLNKNAISYLKDRGIYENSIEKFKIGYASDSNSTINFLKSEFFNNIEAQEMGLIGFDNGKYFARFIERITFPINSTNGKIIGFGGRTIVGHQAKYINSPETKYFNKSRILYAYNHAKDSIHKNKEIIITEGYLDVIMLHQAGFTNSVATLGTALTVEHLPILRKGEPKIIMAYDGDKAGRNAGLKASKLLSINGFNGSIVIFKNGLDPADMVKNGNIEELATLFRDSQPIIEFVLDEIISSYNLKDPKSKESCIEDAITYLKQLSPILQDEYKTYLASHLGINPLLIKIANNNNTNKQLLDSSKHRDIWELTIIKTIIEKPDFLEQILDVLDPSFLNFHSKELKLALELKFSEPSIMAILVDEKIVSLKDEEALKSELIFFLIKHYEKEYKKINLQKELSFEEKAFLIRKYRGKISQLKNGKLVNLF